MKHSEQLDQIGASLAVAQGQMEGALKASANPFFKSKYADLKSVWEACRKPLSDNGLAVVQTVRCEYETITGAQADVAALAAAVSQEPHTARDYPPAVIVTTLLIHVSGQWISEELTMWPKDNSPQAIGSCTSYARRYALAAMVGVYQSDDDAEAAHGRGESTSSAAADDADELNEYLKDLVNAIKAGDINQARSRWNELNVMGTTASIWRVLNTKQKKALRDLLQQTAPPTEAQETAGQEEGGNGPG